MRARASRPHVKPLQHRSHASSSAAVSTTGSATVDAQAADFGPRTALKVVDALREKVLDGQLKSGDAIRAELKASIVQLLESRGGSSVLNFGDAKPGVLLIVGVNGGGKTTTIGKLAHKFVSEGASVSRALPVCR